ncbi:MAG: hypothetical protein KR126chlam1_00891 [Chlamydiae bacterium]|nr:hypothetical protein [Chlamydiota bacterium]
MGLSQSMLSLGRVIIPIIGAYIGGVDAHLFYPIATICVFGAFLILL